MREILFRGQRKDNGEWVCSGNLIQFFDNNIREVYISQYGERCNAVHDIDTDNIETITCENGARFYKVIPETVGQYTGLTDKNGKRIFEGDILKVKSYDYEYEYLTKVFHNSHTLCVDIYGQDYDYTSIGFADDIWDDEDCEIEVIGNVHDNPKLLERG